MRFHVKLILAAGLVGGFYLLHNGVMSAEGEKEAQPGRYGMYCAERIYSDGRVATTSSNYVSHIYVYDTRTGRVERNGEPWCKPLTKDPAPLGTFADLHADDERLFLCDTRSGRFHIYDRQEQRWIAMRFANGKWEAAK